MTGLLIGQLILWLILAVIVIFILYWVMNWLYRRSTKEIAFVRTGFLGERVVIDGGAFVWPIIHDITPVNMNSLDLEVKREKEEALITKDNLRVDVDASFYVRVNQTRAAVSLAASTMGRRTLEPERLHRLLSGKFVSALRTVAAEMTLEQLHTERTAVTARVAELAQEGLDKNGLELESVAITDIDQTDLQYFNPSNRFDAEGLTSVIQAIEGRRKLRNDIEQETAILIRERNLEAEKQALEIERASEEARLEQERDIEFRRAQQRAELTRERSEREKDAEQASLISREAIETSRIANEEQISEARIASEQKIRQQEIEKQRVIDEAEIATREHVEKARISQEKVLSETRIKSAKETEAADIAAKEAVEKARIAQEKNLSEARISKDQDTQSKEIERQRIVDEADIAAREVVEKARIAQQKEVTEAR
ncbi:MAG: SPFH domain-containing protein, partial [Pseudomonadota bacterium]